MSKQGLKYNIQLFVQLLDYLEDSPIDIPVTVYAKVQEYHAGVCWRRRR